MKSSSRNESSPSRQLNSRKDGSPTRSYNFYLLDDELIINIPSFTRSKINKFIN
jgi:hypothetical protein